MTPAALLIDFGGVLTTDPFASFNDFCAAAGLPPDSVTRSLREDPEALAILVDFETGGLDEASFESGFARCLGVEPEGLVDRLMGGLRPQPAMLAAVARARAAGAVTVLVSNSIGMRAYEGYGLDDLFDHQVVSEAVGVRKPSAEIYALGAERAGVAPEACLFVDDLEHNVAAARLAGMAAIHHRDPAETVRLLDEAFA
jgi:epoxide hydrolase-like predicted phosphatase